MSERRITQLPPAGTSSEGDLYPLVQSATTVKQTLSQLRFAIGAVISSLVGLPSSADKLAYYTSPNVLALTPLTSAARSVLDDASFTAMCDTLNSDPSVSVASAPTTAIGLAASPFVTITGTNGITSFGAAAEGVTKEITFSGVLSITHNETSLILPGAANITTTSGDHAKAISLGGGNWSVYSYTRSNGKPVAFAYDRGNSLGIVSQSGGLPTGTVVERGSNANGEYVKFLDGTMICTKSVASESVAVTGAYSPFFQGSAAVWTFPVTFVGAIPTVHCDPFLSGRLAFSARNSTPNLTNAVFAMLDVASNTYNYSIRYSAIGRWF